MLKLRPLHTIFTVLGLVVLTSICAIQLATKFFSSSTIAVKSEPMLEDNGSLSFFYVHSDSLRQELEKQSEFIESSYEDEEPDGIKDFDIKCYFIDSLSGQEDSYLLAFKFKIAIILPKQKQCVTNKRSYSIDDYSVNFNFLLLDENDFCLMKIKTKNGKSAPTIIFVNEESTLDSRDNIVVETQSIPKGIANRTKKIICRPMFEIGPITTTRIWCSTLLNGR